MLSLICILCFECSLSIRSLFYGLVCFCSCFLLSILYYSIIIVSSICLVEISLMLRGVLPYHTFLISNLIPNLDSDFSLVCFSFKKELLKVLFLTLREKCRSIVTSYQNLLSLSYKNVIYTHTHRPICNKPNHTHVGRKTSPNQTY